MMEPSITIFIPTYRRPQFLKIAIESAIHQTVKEIQVVVCDNASQDETSDVVAKLREKDPRIHYICHSKNLGMLGNYQYIFDNVQTDFFSILSDDDILFPNFCELTLKGFSEHPDIIFFAQSIIMAEKEAGVISTPLNRWSREGRFEPPGGLIEMIGKYPVPMGVLFRREAALQAKIDFENQVIWDCDFLVQLAAKFPFAISKKYGGIFRIHSHSFTGAAGVNPFIDGYNKLKARIQNHSFIDDSVKQTVEFLLYKEVYQTKMRYLIKEKKSKEALQVFNALDENRRSEKDFFALFFVALVCAYMPFAHFFLMLTLRLKRSFRRNGWRGFEQYQNLLDQS